ncbi:MULTISPECIES: MBL fold metallo-hydrolase [Bradyrhizobium]|uniref:MBL fold metallo-hydrolase n=2 Tax=Nitrobacteraceae TaxID=41294 RepID=UPI000555EEC9|nr:MULTISPECIES: MBL fold metallo-hydrolase [Bradyrhizobium]UFW46416.1 MBL fold metallo-hydrolase [Bradyrhizobium arachidis]
MSLNNEECAMSRSITLTLIGGPTVLIEYGGYRLLTDPTFDPPGQYQGPHSPVGHVKTEGPSIPIAEIGKLDAVLLSHDHHFDNLDNAGRSLLPTVKAVYTTMAGAQRLGQNAIGFNPFETRLLEEDGRERLIVTATPARHGPIGIDVGDVVGFALGTEMPGDLVYITGDTLWFDGTAEVARKSSPRVVILHTGAAEPRGRFHMTMGSEDALEAAHAFPDAVLVSVHNEGWGHLRESQDQLIDVFAAFNLSKRLSRFEKGRPLTISW